MITVYGKETNAIVYTDILDDQTRAQIETLISQSFMKDVKVRIMADCHKGTGCVIGTTFEIKDKIVPNLVGVDIGCGMLVVKLGNNKIDFLALDNFIHENIPSGMNVNKKISPTKINIEDLKCFNELKQINYVKKSIGSLGGGNHFIEMDKNSKNENFLVIHTGSRYLGKQVAEIYQNKAILYHENKVYNKKEAIKNTIKLYKESGKQKEIQSEIDKIKQMHIELSMPRELCYLEGTDFDNYMFDMDICQKFASENRTEIAKRITTFLGLNFDDLYKFETIHNYINMDDKILRKGSIAAYANEKVIIPLNMRDGCIIAKGKSNPDYNYSAPHGAGRVMSRAEAFKIISKEDFIKAMNGIYTTTACDTTIDEAPFVYKPKESIIKNIKDTVEILEIIKPIYNYKAN